MGRARYPFTPNTVPEVQDLQSNQLIPPIHVPSRVTEKRFTDIGSETKIIIICNNH